MKSRIVLLSALAALAGCGIQGGPESLSILANGDLVVGEGSATKGPFIANSTVTLNVVTQSATATSSTASAIRPVLSPSGRAFTLATDSQGKFDTSGLVFAPTERFVEAHVQGYYFDELAGDRSDDQITLRGVIDIGSQSLNINVLTDLSRKRVLKLVRDKISQRCTVAQATAATVAAGCSVDPTADFAAARKQAEQEVLKAFKIPTDTLGPASFSDLNFKNIANLGLLSKPSAGDQILLALSALVVQIGKDGAGITDFLGAFQSDLEDDGLINNPVFDLANQIARASSTVNYSTVARNMNSYYKSTKYVAADFQQWVDPSGGVVGVIAGRTSYFNLLTTSTTTAYTYAGTTAAAPAGTGKCLWIQANEGTGKLYVNGGTTALIAPYYVTSAAVPVRFSITPTVTAAGTPSLGASIKLVTWPSATSTCPPSVASEQTVEFYAAVTPPGLNLFAQKFIADFAKCFNLTITNRVRATNLSNPDIPEVTQVNDLCKPLAGGPSGDYLHNGYNAGQKFYWMLSDGAMTKTARVVEWDVIDYYISADNRPAARLLVKYWDRYNRLGSFLVFARKFDEFSGSDTGGWYHTGNGQPVDIDILVGPRRYATVPLQIGTTNRSLSDVRMRYLTAFLPIVNSRGPGTVLPDGRRLSAVKVRGPGLPEAGLVLVPPGLKGQWEFDLSNMTGTLPGATPQNKIPRCNNTPPSTGFVDGFMPANCPLVWVGYTNWVAPTNANIAGVTYGTLNFPAIASYATNPTGGVWLPSNTGELMTVGTEYLFSLYYGSSTVPTYEYTKRLTHSMPTLAAIQSLPWVGLDNVGGASLALAGAGTNPFEAFRPLAGQTSMDISWQGHVLNKTEVSSATVTLQRNFYPRPKPDDSVARGFSSVTLAPQLDQDGIPLEMQWSGDMSGDGLGTPITKATTTSPINLSRTISLRHRTWDGSWKSQDYFIDTYSR